MRKSLIHALILALATLFGSAQAPAHPQDGPHVDLRLAIDTTGITFQIGLNLAFIDEALALPREALDQVGGVEALDIEEGLREYLANRVVVEADGRVLAPIIDRYEFFDDPEPWMIGAFPRYGARALIRAAVVVRYEAQDPQVVKITWPTYPRDRVAAELEGMTGPDGLPPYMVLECLLQTTEGGVQIIYFSHARPTIEWHADESGDSRFLAVPPVPTPSQPARFSLLGVVTLALGLGASAVVLRRKGLGAGMGMLAAALAASTAAALVLSAWRVPVPGTGGQLALPSAPGVSAIFEPLHANLYKAFDHASEGEIYDALERSVSGPLLKTLYTQVYNSLVQAEQGGMLGIVTGVEPLALDVQSISADENGRARIDVLHRWRVAGTVYHWGHSHTRVHEYEALYTLAGLEQGWRIVGQQIRQQRWVEGDGAEDAAGLESF